MARRIEVELTSCRPDGSWTWRAAGARQPKGEVDGSLVPSQSAVGDVLRVDADFTIDGITITGVVPPKGPRPEPERLELIGPPRREEGVTTTLVSRGSGERRGRREGSDRRDRRDGRDRGDRGEKGDRGARRARPGDGDRGARQAGRGDKAGRGRTGPKGQRDRRAPERPPEDTRPRAKRLKPGRAHRNAAVRSLPEEMRPLADLVVRGGIPNVRQAIERQNELARADDKPLVNEGPLVALAERLLPPLRTAEWRDRADAALASATEIDLRDLRSVVVASDVAARDEETRDIATRLREALTRRVEQEHQAWLDELASTLTEGRVVRALRLSSRPPKAGSPLPPDLSARLAAGAAANLTAETGPDRFATVLDAVALSPVRTQVVPEGIPAKPSDELLVAVRKLAPRLPQVAALFGIETAPSPPSGRPRRRSSPPPARPPAAAPDPAAPDPGDARGATDDATTRASSEPTEPTPDAGPAVSEVTAEVASAEGRPAHDGPIASAAPS